MRKYRKGNLKYGSEEDYSKYIKNFGSDDMNLYGLNENISNSQNYDLIDDSSNHNKLVGQMMKKFIRLDRECFRDYFDERQKGEVFYSTYLLDEDDKTHGVPHYISTLIKRAWQNSDLFNEIYVPKILNYFGVPTVYNSYCSDEEGNSYVASIDFIKKDERFFSLYEFSCDINDFGSGVSLKNAIDMLGDYYLQMCEVNNIEANKEQLDKILEIFIKSYFVRVLLLEDNDFSSRNFGFLYNEREQSIRVAPNFDFQLCFSDMFEQFVSKEEDLSFLKEHYPEIFCELYDKLCKFAKQRDDEMVYESMLWESAIPSCIVVDKQRQKALKVIGNNVKEILSFCKSEKENSK